MLSRKLASGALTSIDLSKLHLTSNRTNSTKSNRAGFVNCRENARSIRSFVKLLANMHSLDTFRAPAGKNSFSDKIDKQHLKNFFFNVGNSTEHINLAND